MIPISPFLIGLIGSIILVAGAAYPEKPGKHPAKSLKNWLFAIGGVLMLIYSILNYLGGGPIFFIFLQVLVNVSSIFMMANTPDHIDTPIIVSLGILLIIWSLTLFEGFSTSFFILGLIGIGMGYAMNGGTAKRNLSLALGSAMIAFFSYLESDWIFFWLNVFFCIFSAYYVWQLRIQLVQK